MFGQCGGQTGMEGRKEVSLGVWGAMSWQMFEDKERGLKRFPRQSLWTVS